MDADGALRIQPCELSVQGWPSIAGRTLVDAFAQLG
jgi:hypothetical protein